MSAPGLDVEPLEGGWAVENVLGENGLWAAGKSRKLGRECLRLPRESDECPEDRGCTSTLLLPEACSELVVVALSRPLSSVIGSRWLERVLKPPDWERPAVESSVMTA